jgi:GT2 family glycosyltransferase
MISIVTAYFNRKKLLIKTLDSLLNSEIKDFEFIVVDDCSRKQERIEDLMNIYPFLKVIRLEEKNKWYVNPCIPFNIGFKHAKGDKIIIQNPECYHSCDILKYVNENLNDQTYFSFGCYSMTKEQTTNLIQTDVTNIEFKNNGITFEGEEGWYNHSVYRPMAYHFCSAITKSNLNELGGFDERYGLGIAFDDNDLIHRIRLKGLTVKIIDDYIVYHMWHYDNDENATISNRNKQDEKFWELWRKNDYLYHNVTLIENKYKAN